MWKAIEQAQLFMYKQALNVVSRISAGPHLPWVYLLYLQQWFRLEAISPLLGISLHVLIFPWVLFDWFQEKEESFCSCRKNGTHYPCIGSICTHLVSVHTHTEEKRWVLINSIRSMYRNEQLVPVKMRRVTAFWSVLKALNRFFRITDKHLFQPWFY